MPGRWYMPQVMVGASRFEDLYPQPVWDRLLDICDTALQREFEVTPRRYLSNRERFQNFFINLVRSLPQVAPDLIDEHGRPAIRDEMIGDILDFVMDEFFGLGLIRVWLEDPDVEDLLMDSWQKVDVVKGGRKHPYESPFDDDEHATLWMQRLLPTLSAENPIVDGQLADGSRIVCTIPPVTPAAGFSIRRHRAERFQADRYLQSGVAPAEFFADLSTWVKTRQNMLISGATGSGKTTFINYAASLIDPNDRVLVVEDTRELMIPHPRVYPMTATVSGTREARSEWDVTMRKLVKATLRMRPDRIIVGEVRDAAAFDMLNAMNTGHDGGMTTLHSNSPAEAVLRLESLAAPALANMPLWALQDLIGVTVGIIVQMKQVPHSSQRLVVEASQVLHPGQVLDAKDLQPPTRKLGDRDIYLRKLWLYDAKTGQLQRQQPMAPLADQYF